MHKPDLLYLIVGTIRSLVWLIGFAIATFAIFRGVHSRYINVIIALGCFGLAVATGLAAPLLASYHVPRSFGDITTVLALPSAILVVGGLFLRVQESKRIRRDVERVTMEAQSFGATHPLP